MIETGAQIGLLLWIISTIAVEAFVLWGLTRLDKIHMKRMERRMITLIMAETLGKLLDKDSLIYVIDEKWKGKPNEFAKKFRDRQICYMNPGIYAYTRAEVEMSMITGEFEHQRACIVVRFWN